MLVVMIQQKALMVLREVVHIQVFTVVEAEELGVKEVLYNQ